MTIEDVRVLPAGSGRPMAALQHERRSDAQKAQDDIIEKASEAAQRALEASHEALEWLSVLIAPRSRQVTVYVRQLVEEIDELGRVRM